MLRIVETAARMFDDTSIEFEISHWRSFERRDCRCLDKNSRGGMSGVPSKHVGNGREFDQAAFGCRLCRKRFYHALVDTASMSRDRLILTSDWR